MNSLLLFTYNRVYGFSWTGLSSSVGFFHAHLCFFFMLIFCRFCISRFLLVFFYSTDLPLSVFYECQSMFSLIHWFSVSLVFLVTASRFFTGLFNMNADPRSLPNTHFLFMIYPC